MNGRRRAWTFAAAVVLVAVAPAVAAGAPSQATFVFRGAPESFVVPDAVSRVHVVAVGAPGGAWDARARGRGALLEADVAVAPGQRLTVRVGGVAGTYKGGYNGGGDAVIAGDGGGGATDLRTDGDTLADRLLAAGGGGGGGTDAGTNGPSGTDGRAATVTAGGARGGDYDPRCPGQDGALGVGGRGQRGGGGGWYGGGGSSALWDGFVAMDCISDGRGGGGSSAAKAGAGVSNVTEPVLDDDRTPRLTISWNTPDAPPPPPPPLPPAPVSPGASPAAAGLTVRTPRHGSRVRVALQIAQARSALGARLTWRASKRARPRTLARLLRAPTAAGATTFTLKLDRRGRALLRRRHRLRLWLVVTVTPPTGAVITLREGLTLRR